MIDEFDKNGDGTIDLDEFYEYYETDFDILKI